MRIWHNTQKVAVAIEIAGRGPEDTAADVGAGGAELVGGIWAIGQFLLGHSDVTVPVAGKFPSAPAGTTPPSTQTKTEDKKSSAQERADKLSKTDRSGKDFTKAGKAAVKDVNKEKNGGEMKCEKCGTNTKDAAQHTKGEAPPSNEAHVDHIIPKAKGGSGTPANGQVLCRECNLEKGAN